ncbi:2-polyprenyl-6-methoxyphenol hydroxylase [Micromonospora viridifaciens]|uniref:2-polyprenyl-6-methoxyphenol hydroxylase n=1 Tax=Micromonospora viridifaciens TaxID=1881 RepID=A0A1C4WUR8_MICVI|nr:FAD-dependent monooxygenase [Micromonospora viridifaciens]SCF00036.1 2-polyprenyl-6-methoxyphenol hydroxylase [Micromonospora viridifaciens]
MELTRPILVTGAGVGGLTAALALARHGFSVQVYERRELAEITTNAGFGHTIWSNATTSLRTLGLGERLLARAEPMLGFESRNSRQQVMFRMNTAESIWPGCAPTVGIGRGDLIGLLREACLERGVRIEYGQRATGYEITGDEVTLKLADGSTVTGAALIGADGIRSTILEQLHGRLPVVYTGRSTYRGIAPGTCGLQRGTVHLFSDPDSRFGGGAWLIGGDRVVWTLSCERTPGTEDPQGIPARAREIADVLGGPAPAFVGATPTETVSRIDVYYHEWLDRWGEGPVTLLGDAAHALPTDLGQGACMAIEDGVVLADCLATAADVPAGLREYERRRRERVHWVREHVLRVNRFKPIRNKALRWIVGKIAKVVVASSAPKMWREVQRPPDLTAELRATGTTP